MGNKPTHFERALKTSVPTHWSYCDDGNRRKLDHESVGLLLGLYVEGFDCKGAESLASKERCFKETFATHHKTFYVVVFI